MTFFQEELLEPPARFLRFWVGLAAMRRRKKVRLVDLGSGPEIRFRKFARFFGIDFEEYTAIDPLINYHKADSASLKLIKSTLTSKIPLEANSYDYVVAFATIEHMKYPAKIIDEAIKILRTGGRLIITTPTNQAKLLLETLAFKLGLISNREIEEHKNYFDRDELLSMVDSKQRQVKATHKYFELGLNNLLVVEKL